MKKLIFLILIVTLACNTEEKTKITLKSNNSVWNAYQGYHFERELIICGVDSVQNIYLENKLNETDEIRHPKIIISLNIIIPVDLMKLVFIKLQE